MLDLSMVIFVRTTCRRQCARATGMPLPDRTLPDTRTRTTIKAVVKKFALGFLNSTTAASTIHVQFVNPTTGGQGTNAYEKHRERKD
jgi:hypothetical protein